MGSIPAIGFPDSGDGVKTLSQASGLAHIEIPHVF